MRKLVKISVAAILIGWASPSLAEVYYECNVSSSGRVRCNFRDTEVEAKFFNYAMANMPELVKQMKGMFDTCFKPWNPPKIKQAELFEGFEYERDYCGGSGQIVEITSYDEMALASAQIKAGNINPIGCFRIRMKSEIDGMWCIKR